MKRLLYFGSMVVFAIVVGVGSAWWVISESGTPKVRIGSWRFNPLIGNSSVNAYRRASVGPAGLLASARSEAIYFGATEDGDGQPLTGDLSFRIEGKDLPARWWSITAYDKDLFLIPNELNRYSINSSNLVRNAGGTFVIHVSPSATAGNWIPTGNDAQVVLVLRLYNPDPSVVEDFDGIELPRIVIEEPAGA